MIKGIRFLLLGSATLLAGRGVAVKSEALKRRAGRSTETIVIGGSIRFSQIDLRWILRLILSRALSDCTKQDRYCRGNLGED